MHPLSPPTLAAALAAATLWAAAPAKASEDMGALAVVTFVLPGRPAASAGPAHNAPGPAALEPTVGSAPVLATGPLPAPPPATAAPSAPLPGPAPGALALHTLAQTLWEEIVPDALKDEHELLAPEELATLVQRLCAAGQSDDLSQLADFAPEARRAISSLRARPGFEDYAAWLANQLDEIEAAEIVRNDFAGGPLFTPPPPPAQVATTAVSPSPPRAAPPAPGAAAAPLNVPYFELWLDRMADRPRPARADELLPSLRAAFIAEGVPPALVWLAETESSFNPRARNPIGARGLFQIMPETARSLGLGLWPDERVHPVRSAHAAAAYLRYLHGRFGDWPLALAAYNAGETRVSRELRRRDATDFAGIARHLPAETRLYVPKVLATIQVREGVSVAELPAPRS